MRSLPWSLPCPRPFLCSASCAQFSLPKVCCAASEVRRSKVSRSESFCVTGWVNPDGHGDPDKSPRGRSASSLVRQILFFYRCWAHGYYDEGAGWENMSVSHYIGIVSSVYSDVFIIQASYMDVHWGNTTTPVETGLLPLMLDRRAYGRAIYHTTPTRSKFWFCCGVLR